MTSLIAAIHIVGPAGEPATVAAQAARRAFPEAMATRTDALAEVSDKEFATGTELLVLLRAADADLKRASTTRDVRGWPRWAIVTCSSIPAPPDSHAMHVPPEDWSEPVVALAYSAAVRLRALRAENIQRSGDLRTIARRMGHDMRSPLSCIATSAEAMADPSDGPDSPRVVFAQSIASSVEEVVTLLDRISFILKATTNPLPRQPTIMEEIVWGALQRLESRMLRAKASVTQPEKWPVLEAVPAWCDVIWDNLISNSLDHAGANPRIELGWEQLPGEYRFWVRDQGGGVAEKKDRQLFYPLDRLSELNAPRGFGLPIVHRLVELQGGRCGHTREATGSGTFYFTLPSVAPSPPA